MQLRCRILILALNTRRLLFLQQYAEQYQNATLEMKYLFHYGMSSTFSTLLNNNDNNLYNNENIKALYDVEVTTQPELIDLKNYLGL